MTLNFVEDGMEKLTIILPTLIDLKNGVDVKGEINKKIDEKEYDHYVMDLSELEFIDSLGLGILVGIQRKINALNKKIIFKNPKESIKRVFEVTQLQRVFDIIEE